MTENLTDEPAPSLVSVASTSEAQEQSAVAEQAAAPPPAVAVSALPAIEIRGFRHVYGQFVAVDDMDVSLPQGSITGFIGPNGAGKTTTIRLLVTLLQPTRGDAFILGKSCTRRPRDVRQLIGYMPDSFGVYEGLNAREYLRFFAEAYDLPHTTIDKTIDEVSELVGLTRKLQTPCAGLSLGQRQRLSLARTLLHDPRVLILDEPAGGLDPLARMELLYILRELRNLGKTILLSSHILTEVAEVSDHLMILNDGKLVAAGTVESIVKTVRPHFTIEVQVLDGATDRVVELLEQRDISGMRQLGNSVEFDFVGDHRGVAELHRSLFEAGLPIIFFQPVDVSLEQAFAKLTRTATRQDSDASRHARLD